MAKSNIPAKTRAAAIADLQAGDQPAIVAARYGIDAAQMRVWKQRYVTHIVTDDTPRIVLIRPSLEQEQIDIARLVKENLRAKLIATQRIAEYAASNPDWLEKQTAADVGELFERIDQSAITILDRMASAGRGSSVENSDPAGTDQR